MKLNAAFYGTFVPRVVKSRWMLSETTNEWVNIPWHRCRSSEVRSHDLADGCPVICHCIWGSWSWMRICWLPMTLWAESLSLLSLLLSSSSSSLSYTYNDVLSLFIFLRITQAMSRDKIFETNERWHYSCKIWSNVKHDNIYDINK